MEDIEYRVASMLKTLAVGDALGKICSKYTAEEVVTIYGDRVTALVKPVRKSSYEWQCGSVTDDTTLTLLVADSLLQCRSFNRKDVARRLIHCEPRGGTQIRKLKQNANLDYVAVDGETNGAAIRVSALAVVFSDMLTLSRNVIDLSTLTHGTNEAITAALLTSFSQYYYLRSPHDSEVQSFLVRSLRQYYPKGLKTRAFTSLAAGFRLTKAPISQLPDLLEETVGYSKYCWSSVPTAIVLGCTSPNCYETLIRIIHRKKPLGDLDSVASIAGSIIGLRLVDPIVYSMATIVEETNNLSFTDYAAELVKLRNDLDDQGHCF